MKTRYLVASLLLTTLVATSAFALVRTSTVHTEQTAADTSFDSAPLLQSKLGPSRPL